MKKTIIFLIMVLLSLSFVQVSNALTITVIHDPPDVLLNSDNPTYTPSAPNPFDLTAQLTGYTVTNAILNVVLSDNPSGFPDGGAEYVNITVDGNLKINNDEVGAGIIDPEEVYSINVLPEMNDKKLILVVQCLEGDFYYCSATLEVTYDSVPLSPSAVLLGSGLLGLAAARSRRP